MGSLRVSLLNVREVSGGEVPEPMGRECTGWRDWVGRVNWRGVAFPGGWGVGENPTPKAHEFPPQFMARSLSNIESGGLQTANNNFVG